MSPHAVAPSSRNCLSLLSLLDRFAVTHNAFLPSELPLDRLPDPSYEPWERIGERLPFLIQQRRLQSVIDQMEIISIDALVTEGEWRRAYVLLAFLAQGYIWGGDVPEKILPPSISIPFLAVSHKLELPPVLTYAASNLWNFTSTSPDFSDLDQITSVTSFTGTKDESWFFSVSVAMEAKAAYAIPSMTAALEAVTSLDYTVITQALGELTQCILDIGVILERMYEGCDPSVFYHRIRPFLAGSKNMVEAGLPNGVFYDEGNGEGEWWQLRGGSNGQSSLIQFFDLVLGIEHEHDGNTSPHPSVKASAPSTRPLTFHEEVRDYMPGPHRRFLKYIREKSPSIRSLALHPAVTAEQQQLRAAYSTATETLKLFREKHIKLVTMYIILPSRKASANQNKERGLAASSNGQENEKMTGTGGTPLLPFLKQSRDETGAAGRVG